ncbi:MAG: hypothetical protein ACK46Q_03050 [Hyphomonas sp.]
MSGTERWLCGLFLLIVAACAPAHAQLSDAEERGRQIYFGEAGSPLDTATARINGMDVRLPAKGFPCASCHGRSGSGFAERGAVPTDLSRGALTRPYSVTASQGRRRPPYTVSGFRAAVRTGKDPGGSTLSEAMPRFDLSDRQLGDLWAFLNIIDTLNDPGINDTEITIGVALAPHTAGTAQRKLLDVLASDINALGGIHGRSLRFAYQAAVNTPEADVFATLAIGNNGALPHGLPVISVSAEQAGQPQGFSLLAGAGDQTAALRRFAAEQWGAVTLRDACDASAGQTRLLSSSNCLAAGQKAERLLMPQAVFAAIPPAERRSLPDETYVALTAPVRRVAPQAQAAFARTRARAGTARETIIAESEAYSAAAVIIEALMRSGRDLSRERLVLALEEMRNFEGAMTPPLSFGRNRRTGSRGVEIVKYSPQTGNLSTEGPWVDPGP